MKTEKGVMIVAYKDSGSTPRFLMLKRDKGWEGWETPKGGLENDDYEETVRIEMREETGISEDQIEEVEDMDREASWKYERDGEERKKVYKCFLVKVAEESHVDTSENPCDEHEQGFFFRYRDAEQLITYDNNLEVLDEAREMIDND